MSVAFLAFWGSLGFVFYAYLGYPMILFLLGMMRRRVPRLVSTVPCVSVIIAAHNEEARIREKIDNTLMLEYPPDLFQVIVASDCSTDDTDAIVRSYEHRAVELARTPMREGKEAAQELAIGIARGDILVFTDTAARLPSDVVQNLVRNFADSSIGCVSSRDRLLTPDGAPGGEGAYVRYEMWLRGLESKAGSLVGLSGSLFAARRAVCRPWKRDLASDFSTLLNCAGRGLRGVLDRECVASYTDVGDPGREFERKTRTVVRGITALFRSHALLNPIRYGLFSWQLVSHKLCRWLVPFAMMGMFLSNSALAGISVGYFSFFMLQTVFYLGAFASLLPLASRLSTPWNLPGYLLLSNVAIVNAWSRYFRGERITAWTPSQR